MYLSGEGKSELGNANAAPAYRQEREPGVLHALLDHAAASAPSSWAGVGVKAWKDVRKFKAGDHASAEARTVLGLALDATEANAHILAFVRDRDRVGRRQADIEAGIAWTADKFPDLAIVGGVAIECIESWVLLCAGERPHDSPARCKELCKNRGLASSAEMVEAIVACDRAELRGFGCGLGRWICDAERAISAIEP